MSEQEIVDELFVLKNALFDLKEKVIDSIKPDFKSRYLLFLYLGITYEQSRAIDHLFISYNFAGEMPSMQELKEKLTTIIDSPELSESVVEDILMAYDDDKLIPIVGDIVKELKINDNKQIRKRKEIDFIDWVVIVEGNVVSVFDVKIKKLIVIDEAEEELLCILSYTDQNQLNIKPGKNVNFILAGNEINIKKVKLDNGGV